VIDGSQFPTAETLQATGAAQANLHQRAAELASRQFGNKVFVRAVVEASNFCRENCSYCGMRRDNRTLDRHRADLDRLADLLIHHRPASITDVNIQTGEDPVVVRDVVIPLVRLLREHTDLGISVCLGTLNREMYSELLAAGAGTYILKFEIGNAEDYDRFEAPGTQPERLAHIRLLAEMGWNVSSGFIAGLPGQSIERVLENFTVAQSLPLDGCSVSPFIAGESTPLSESATGSLDLALNCMAALRLMSPDWVIPAVSALNLAGGPEACGYRRGLRTGANLATINLTPADLRADYLLYKRDRVIMNEEKILGAIAAEGREVSRQSLAEFYRQRNAAKAAPKLAAVV
jgi:biotin synthase